MASDKVNFCCFLLFAVLLYLLGCNDEGKEVNPTQSLNPNSILSPTISALTIRGNQISRANGGILKLSCQWTSPTSVSSSVANVAFVRSLNDPQASPTGIISTGTATVSTSLSLINDGFFFSNILTQSASQSDPASPTVVASTTTIATTTVTASETTPIASGTASSTTFFEKFTNPLVIPSGIGNIGFQGTWEVEIPFPANVVSDAPLGKQQLLLWMIINGKSTNSLAFEIEFIP